MNNISQISKAKRLTEEEIHAAAEELKESGIKVSSIEIYKFLGRGSLTTITNFLKTWKQDTLETTTLPSLIALPEALRKSTEQLVIKLWAESQELAEKEINSQREDLRQAEATANERIAEAQAFSEEQSKQIEALEARIDELKEEKSKDHGFFLTEEKRLQKEIEHAKKGEGILEQRIFENDKQLKDALEKIKELEAINREAKTFELKAGHLEAEVHNLKANLNELRKHSDGLTKSCENLKEQKIKIEAVIGSQEGQINELNRSLNKAIDEREAEIKDNKSLREKAAKLEGELTAWKEIKPKQKTTKKVNGDEETVTPSGEKSQ